MAFSCKNAIWLAVSLLGTVVGFVVFIVFLLPAEQNYYAAVWGLFSGVCASLALHLNYLHAKGSLSLWHSLGTLERIFDFGFVSAVLSSATLVWFIFCTIYYKTSVLPVHQSTIIPAIWALMTLKWAISIMICCKRFSQYLGSLNYLRMDTD